MRKNPLPPTLKLRRTCRLSKLSHLPFAAYPSTHIWIAFFTLLKSTKRICSQDDCTAPDRYRGTPALLGLGLSLIHKSESREVSNQWLLPLPREGGSRSTFDKLRAGETEGFSAEPKRFVRLDSNDSENPSVSADRAPKGHFTTSPSQHILLHIFGSSK